MFTRRDWLRITTGPQRPANWYAPNFMIKAGRLAVPQGPGFGLEIDPEYLAKAGVVAKIS